MATSPDASSQPPTAVATPSVVGQPPPPPAAIHQQQQEALQATVPTTQDTLPALQPNGVAPPEAPAATASGAATAITPPAAPTMDDIESRLIERLMAQLTAMGLSQTATPPVTQTRVQTANGSNATQDASGDHDAWSQWQTNQGWNHWDWNQDVADWNSWDSWKKDKFDGGRPYLSHLDFPKFDGRKEEYPNYKYQVLNLESQCSLSDHKYLARSMELNSADYLVDNGIELLLELIRKRLNIRDLDLGTEAFDKYFNHMMRKRARHSQST